MECELCGRRAMMFCESDQARLCCDCDEKVHGANFLVAKHHRTLLCYVCQSLTPWIASGPKLTPTVSVCEGCVDSHRRKCGRSRDQESQGGNEVEDDGSYEGSVSEGDDEELDEEEEDEDEEADEEEEDGENQVVPWSQASSSPPPSPPTVSSSSEGFFSGGGNRETLKRRRETGDDFDSDDEIQCSSSQRRLSRRRLTSDGSTSPISFPPPKHLRPTIGPDQPSTNQDFKDDIEVRSTAIIKSIKRLQNGMATDCNDASRTILGMSKLSRDQSH